MNYDFYIFMHFYCENFLNRECLIDLLILIRIQKQGFPLDLFNHTELTVKPFTFMDF